MAAYDVNFQAVIPSALLSPWLRHILVSGCASLRTSWSSLILPMMTIGPFRALTDQPCNTMKRKRNFAVHLLRSILMR